MSFLPMLIPFCSLQVKLMKYICKQLQCKQKVPETERPEALDSYPHLRDWLRTINLRPELIQVRCLAVISSVQSCSSSFRPPLVLMRSAASPQLIKWIKFIISLCCEIGLSHFYVISIPSPSLPGCCKLWSLYVFLLVCVLCDLAVTCLFYTFLPLLFFDIFQVHAQFVLSFAASDQEWLFVLR